MARSFDYQPPMTSEAVIGGRDFHALIGLVNAIIEVDLGNFASVNH